MYCFKINKKVVILVFCVLLFVSSFLAIPSAFASAPNYAYTIVIDAGHGGIDGGSVSPNGIDENNLNLEYALCLKKIISQFNIKVVMTRTSLNGLYSTFSKNKKQDDMQRRKEIVEKSNADFVISIHMNSFALKSAKGAQVFYKKDNEPSKVLAETIQSVFVLTLPNAREHALVGDYFMLNEFEIPSVIVECGYLSNPEEEKLLQQEDYKTLVCYSIFGGLLKFLAK